VCIFFHRGAARFATQKMMWKKMKTIKQNLTWGAFAAAIARTLVACGGSGGNSSGTETPVNTATLATASALYAGPIGGFGSVIVNGVHFSSVGAELVDDDAQALTLAQLKLGMALRVTGNTDDSTLQGTASRLELVHGNRGQVTVVNLNTGTLTLLGLRVVTNATTIDQGVAALAGLTVGQPVEVYGALQADGSLLATLIELKPALTSINLKGRISGLTATTFQVGSLTVNYSAAQLPGAPREGKQVKIKASTGPVDDVLSASSVQVFDSGSVYGASVVAGTWFKIKAVVDAAPVDGLLTLSGTPFDISGATIKGCTTIVVGQLIEIKGNWNGSELQAIQVKVESYRESQIGARNELYGTVSSISGNVAVVNGVTVDLSGAVYSYGNTAQILVGSYVEIKDNMTGNTLQANKVELKNGSAAAGASYEQYGQISNVVSSASFEANGLKVDASQAVFERDTAADLVNGIYVEIKGDAK
jgi:hypothetical protein